MFGQLKRGRDSGPGGKRRPTIDSIDKFASSPEQLSEIFDRFLLPHLGKHAGRFREQYIGRKKYSRYLMDCMIDQARLFHRFRFEDVDNSLDLLRLIRLYKLQTARAKSQGTPLPLFCEIEEQVRTGNIAHARRGPGKGCPGHGGGRPRIYADAEAAKAAKAIKQRERYLSRKRLRSVDVDPDASSKIFLNSPL